MITAVIFDLDGVLVTTDELHYEAWKEMADLHGIYFDKTINDRLRGVSRMASLEIILERADRLYDLDEKEEMAAWKNARYVILLDGLTPDDLLPGALDTLRELKENGILTAIGSSSRNTPKILDRLGIRDQFDAVSDGNNITRSKPDPEVFLKGAQFLGLAPDDCAVVEDAVAGIDAANAGGFMSIGIGDAASYEKADAKITRIGELLDLV